MHPKTLRLSMLLAAFAVAGLAGCIGGEEGPPAATESPQIDGARNEETEPPARAVVADIGPGTNPYHEAFRRPNWTAHPCHSVPDLPCSIPTLNLTFSGNYSENVQADEGVWETYETGRVYWVEQTNLLLWTARPWDCEDQGVRCSEQPTGRASDDGTGSHGAATAGAVNDACQRCYVLAVQDGNSLDGGSVREMARNLTYVDVATSSFLLGDRSEIAFQGDREFAEATYELWESGTPFVAFSGNQVVTGFRPNVNPFPLAEVQFPPWVYLAGGAHPECDSSESLAGKPPEVVGDFTQRLPEPAHVTARSNISGTSFATPQIAGELGELLLELRRSQGPGPPSNSENATMWKGNPVPDSPLADGRLQLPELRTAIHHSATYFETGDYRHECGTQLRTPVGPGPYVQMGWGYVGDNETGRALNVVLGNAELPEKSENAKRFMETFRDFRETLYPWPDESES